MKQLTLISLYGPKPPPLLQQIQTCQEIIQHSPLGKFFRPYRPDQVHGTIVGMEKLDGYEELFNANIWHAEGVHKRMDFTRLIPTVEQHLPMKMQFGGFPPDFDAFQSFGRRPYERSFQVQWPAHRFTLIGWPHENGDFASRRLLQELRDDLDRQCHLRHKWGADNDLFMVLGEIIGVEELSDRELSALQKATAALEREVRDYLARHPIYITIGEEDVYIAQYVSRTLELGSTMVYRVSDLGRDLGFVRGMYG